MAEAVLLPISHRIYQPHRGPSRIRVALAGHVLAVVLASVHRIQPAPTVKVPLSSHRAVDILSPFIW